MSDIPEDIRKAASECADNIAAHCEPGASFREAVEIELARALISAEARGMERAAKIADEHIFTASQWGRADEELSSGNRRAREIAAAIRNSTEASDA